MEEIEIQGKEFAGFWIRVGATLLDFLVLLVVLVFNILAVYFWKDITLMLICNIITISYKPVMEFLYGATVGKMVLKLKVVTTNYESLSVQHTVLRSLPWLLSGVLSLTTLLSLMGLPEYQEISGFVEITELQEQVTPQLSQQILSFVFLVSVIFVAFDHKKRGLHDMIASTYCIKME